MRHFIFLFVLISIATYGQKADTLFSLKSIKSYPFPNELCTAPTGSRVAWAFNESGLRNIYVAEGPDFKARKLTNYNVDDGQELTSVSLSQDGSYVVYVRGGDHGSNWEDHQPVNPMSSPVAQKVQIWSVAFAGGEPKLLGDGEEPVISSKGIVAFHKGGQIYSVPVDGSTEAKQLFSARGTNNNPQWSPDGNKLAFQSNRNDHSFIGIYANASTYITWMEPGYDRDVSPRWSPDATRVAFVRMNGNGGEPDSVLTRHHNPWSIYSGDIATGKIKKLWMAPTTLRGSVPTTHGGTNLHWAFNRIVFLSYHDGWPHLYSVNEFGTETILLTPGNFMCEYIKMSADRKWMVAAANAGDDPFDIDRRHIIRVPVDKPAMQVLTPGSGLEWTPAITGDGQTIVYLSASSTRPPLPTVMPMKGGMAKLIGEDRIPRDFPSAKMITPKQIIFKSPDGLNIHAEVFEQPGSTAKKPAIVYVHGGPPRQMLMGWHYSDYYSNAYAMNQYLASRGFIVVAVNYRLGIGYGYEFHQPAASGPQGASEYLDVKAAADWLTKQSNVDAKRIGIYGGSYGGYLTAVALTRNSDLFATGVDIHGVHDWTNERSRNILARDKYEKIPDGDKALQTAWDSSPTSSISGWKSPVLIIHGDDDRNVRFNQSTDLIMRLRKTKVEMETLIIPDDTHHFMMHRNQLKVNTATAEYLERKLKR